MREMYSCHEMVIERASNFTLIETFCNQICNMVFSISSPSMKAHYKWF